MDSRAVSVLIVDRDLQLCRLLRNEVSRHGSSCSTASGIPEARKLLSEQPFDIVIVDVSAPGTSGLDLLAHVRTESQGCRVILTGGTPRRDSLSQAFFLGAYDFVEKPFRTEDIVQAVANAACGDTERPALYEKAALAMEQASQVRQAAFDGVRALIQAVEAKDPYTRRHSEHVAHYAVNLAEAMGLPPQAVESARLAALLHDIGKIGVPDHILTKPGPLTDEEFQHIRRHPLLGADILANITLFRRESELVRHHHEKWDGRGYPDRLRGEESPLISRIILVADSIDAMLMARTYKRAYSVGKMQEELASGAGTQFDPAIAAAALAWCRSNPAKLILLDSIATGDPVPVRNRPEHNVLQA
jgi:putative nucleotidyltransferase with HDIG domain